MPTESEIEQMQSVEWNNGENSDGNIGFIKRFFVVIGTLFVFALLAFFISAIIWYKENNYENPPSCKKRIVGYYLNWEHSVISESQLELMTHAVFAVIQMDVNGTLSFQDSHSSQRFLHLKSAARAVTDVQVMVSIGGYTNSQYFSTVVADENKRSAFISSIRSFIEGNEIDGVDIFWKWVDAVDKYNYALFLKELRTHLTTSDKGYIISIVLPPAGVSGWELEYSLDDIMNSVDFVNVFTMDYYGPWPDEWGTPTGPIAPLHDGIGLRKNWNVDWTMNYYTCEVGSGSKLNIVIPFYARLWENVENALSSKTEVFRNVSLIEGEAQGEPYMSRLTVYDDGYILEPSSWDEKTETSYIWSPENKTFLTFETTRSIESKTKYVMEMDLGGVWIWSVDMDDENNSLLKSVSFDKFCDDPTKYITGYQC